MEGTAMMMCRDRFGVFPIEVFQLWTCTMCYTYLFPPPSSPSGRPHHPVPPSPLATPFPTTSPSYSASDSSSSSSSSSSSYANVGGILSPWGEIVYPNMSNTSSVLTVCSWLESNDCSRWLDCCHAAIECCRSQVLANVFHQARAPGVSAFNVSEERLTASSVADLARQQGQNGSRVGEEGDGDIGDDEDEGGKEIMCPQTWDGMSCVAATAAGSEASLACPSFLHHSLSAARGYRVCTENGTWWSHPVTGHEWTDYTACGSLKDFYVLYVVGTVCNSLSLLFLLPACAIFLSYRTLRRQQRIHIHVNLVMSFVLTNASLLLWENIVYRDRLLNVAHESNMHHDTAACRVLYCITRYAWVTAFMWMFVEGFHLYRLITRAFHSPVSIRRYYLIGWGVPVLPVSAYIAVRVWHQHESCWVQNAGLFEWIIYTPQLLCILSNVVFFACILRILVTEIQSHEREPSNFRRALRATFLLVPLFGLQLFLVAYSPGPVLSYMTYEVAAKTVSSSQGAVIAIIFCFFNCEIQGKLRTTFSNLFRQFANRHDHHRSVITMSSNMAAGIESTRGSYSVPKTAMIAAGGVRDGRSSYSRSSNLDRLDPTNYIALHAWTQRHSPPPRGGNHPSAVLCGEPLTS